ncbi:MAG: hypothetical protein EOO77_45260 [Oxalobacteraceae bacterium]|nr:MAG: hypothetical protein EOO77_45260 [Oxalobacteraceae bacterium]
MTERFLYSETGFVPTKLFQFLPMATRHAMLANIVTARNLTGSVTMIGDDMVGALDRWCVANCTARWCYMDGCLMFEAEADKKLFLLARPQS